MEPRAIILNIALDHIFETLYLKKYQDNLTDENVEPLLMGIREKDPHLPRGDPTLKALALLPLIHT